MKLSLLIFFIEKSDFLVLRSEKAVYVGKKKGQALLKKKGAGTFKKKKKGGRHF